MIFLATYGTERNRQLSQCVQLYVQHVNNSSGFLEYLFVVIFCGTQLDAVTANGQKHWSSRAAVT
jgi:hypothetical protein